jgi:hypothetical protein
MSALEVRGYFGEHAAARDTHSNRYQLVDEAPVFVDCPVTVIVDAVATAIENGLVDQGIAIVVDTRRTTASRGFALVVSRITGGRAQWVRDARAALAAHGRARRGGHVTLVATVASVARLAARAVARRQAGLLTSLIHTLETGLATPARRTPVVVARIAGLAAKLTTNAHAHIARVWAAWNLAPRRTAARGARPLARESSTHEREGTQHSSCVLERTSHTLESSIGDDRRRDIAVRRTAIGLAGHVIVGA